jgi:hypothetical protein
MTVAKRIMKVKNSQQHERQGEGKRMDTPKKKEKGITSSAQSRNRTPDSTLKPHRKIITILMMESEACYHYTN